MPAHPVLGRIRHHALAVCSLTPGPVPRSAMLRSGGAIGVGFVVLLALGHLEAAVIGAFFLNFLCLADRAEGLVPRLVVQVVGAAVFAVCGSLGIFVAGDLPLTLATVFGVALVAGLVHGSLPGLEAIPRFGLCCLVVAAFLPVGTAESARGIGFGTVIALAAVVADDLIRNGRRGVYAKRLRASVSYPGPRFSLVYGSAAVCGLVLGVIAGGVRPYWVTVTTLLVMQPDRRANTVRVLQRFLGTLAGVVLAFAAVRALPDAFRTKGLLALVVTLPFVWPLGFERNYALGTAVLSAWVLLLIDTALPSSDLVTAIFLARLSDTSIGCAVALAGSFVVYEAREGAAA